MRVLTVLTLSVVAFSCGKSEVPDAGVEQDAGFDAGPPPLCLPDFEDAGPPGDGGLDFSCRGRAPSSGGQAQLVVSGTATRAGFTRTPMEGILIDLLSLDGTVLASAVSNDAGVYRLAWDAGCYPLDGEVRATHPNPDAGYAVAYTSPAAPWKRDRAGLELVLFDTATRNLAAGIANVTLVDGGAVLALAVEDCNGNGVRGALVATTGAVGDVRYVGAAGLPTTMQMSTGPKGEVVIFNIPGSSVEVIATLDGGVIGQRVVQVHSDAATGTFLSP